MKQITVLYFAQFAAQAGCAEEVRKTAALNPAELFAELQQEHGWQLPLERVRFARNDAFCSMDEPLAEGDAIAIMPPMSGG